MTSTEVRNVNIDELWRNFKILKDPAARDQLIVHYAPLVKYVAGRVAINLPKSVDEGDLIGYGSLGLIDAIERFDPQRGVKFETYAIARIRGAMIDGLRSMDWVPVSVRHRNKTVEKPRATWKTGLGGLPQMRRFPKAGITVEEYNNRIRDMVSSSILSLEDVWGNPEDGDALSRMSDIKDEKPLINR